MEQGRQRRQSFPRTAGQREGSGRKAREARGSPRQEGRRDQEGDGRGRSASSTGGRGRAGQGRSRRQERVVACIFSQGAVLPDRAFLFSIKREILVPAES